MAKKPATPAFTPGSAPDPRKIAPKPKAEPSPGLYGKKK